MKNLILILGIITIAAAGYYFYVKQEGDVSFDDNAIVTANMLASTQVFMERRAILESLSVDTSIFENEKFTTLRSFNQPIVERPLGRTNPFDPPEPPPLNTTP